MNWIETILHDTQHVETPKAFIRWSLFSAISAVTAPNISLNKQGAYDLYPNVYVMLLADSGIGKGFGIWIAKALVTAVDTTRVFSGRNSIQKIVQDLSISYTRKGKDMIKDARAFLASGEFINFLLRDDQSISILTEFYDTHYLKEWKNSLKSSGTEVLSGVNITLLGASNPDYLRESVPVAAIRGGFFGRLMLVHATEKGQVNALIDDIDEERKVSDNKIKDWSKYLIELSKIEPGSQFKVDNLAREFYRPWYYNYQDQIRKGIILDKTGYIHRMHDHALKLAMVISLSESTDLVLAKPHVEEGIMLAESLLATIKKTTIGIGLSAYAPKNEAFMRSLFKAPDQTMTRQKILSLNHSEFDSLDLDKMTLTLEDAGFIKSQKEGKELQYTLTLQGRRQFLDIQAELKRKRGNETRRH